VAVHDSAGGGAIRVRLGPAGVGSVLRRREQEARLWRER
jgi:hypothetical protein